tara:strand:+ start:1404 stop:1823 length:420 start_codon:yes stop_codon:yes gene_type:complete
MKVETSPGEKGLTPQISRERESALCAVVFVLVLNVSLVSFVLSFLSLSQRNENNFVSLSLFCLLSNVTSTRERERGDCDGIPPWCWKSGLDEDEDEDEDCKGDETKERRGDVDDDDVRDAPSFLVFALVFVRSCDSTDG